ncbi:hypothetical protein ABZ646_20410 [Streptomyces sp. NPDC007162]|uniref:hypothetical protein n=1 Tax=Streptomyces sp. NPDC007162 TaxID=3156917 RepID=UPI0033D0889D
MSATAGSRTGRVRVRAVDDRPVPGELPPVAVAGRHPCLVPDGTFPGLGGLQVPRGPRYETPKPPVLILPARGTSSDSGGDLVEARISGLRHKAGRGQVPRSHAGHGSGHVNRAVEDGR